MVAHSNFVLFDVVVSIDYSVEMSLCDWFILVLFIWILQLMFACCKIVVKSYVRYLNNNNS